MEIFALINDSFYMLKKIIKTHTARLDYDVDITKPTFLRNAVATNRQRRVIASNTNFSPVFFHLNVNIILKHFRIKIQCEPLH